jgi:hypothetical protein
LCFAVNVNSLRKGKTTMADITLTAANVVPTANTDIGRGTAYEAINAGQPVYADANNSFKLRVAGNGSAAAAAVVGIALNTAAANQPLSYAKAGDINTASQLTAGTPYVLGNTAGNISPGSDLESSSGTRYGTQIGVGVNATTLRLAIAASGVLNP